METQPTTPEEGIIREIPKPKKLTLTEIMARPLPEITPEKQAELDELEAFFQGNK